MNLLQLTNDYIKETGVGDPIGSVVNQLDEYGQAVSWVVDAWVEIQRSRNWNARWAEASFNAAVDTSSYSLTTLGRVSGDDLLLSSFAIQSDSGVYTSLFPRHYSQIRHMINRDAAASQQPRFFAQFPDGSIRVYPLPDAVRAVRYEYYVAPVVLVDDLDTPNLDPKFHKAIVWKALEQYAREQGKEWDGLYQAAIRNFNAIYTEMLSQETGRAYLAPSPFSR